MKIATDLETLFRTFFHRSTVNRLARQTGFLKRRGRLDGLDFLLALSLGRFKKSGP